MSDHDRVGVGLPPPLSKKHMIVENSFEKLVNRKRVTAAQNFSLKVSADNRLELHLWSNDGKIRTQVHVKYYYLDHNWTIFCIDKNSNKYSLLCSTDAHRNNPKFDLQTRTDIIYLLEMNARLIAYFA